MPNRQTGNDTQEKTCQLLTAEYNETYDQTIEIYIS
jgi:hypothetical protein